MNVIVKDILTIERGVIVHQVNCRGMMGRGLALSIRRKWPVVFTKYQAVRSQWKPGLIQLVNVGPSLVVCNLAGQDGYGLTNYDAVRNGLLKVKVWADVAALPVHIPWYMGCSNGGGDWTIVSRIIQEVIPEAIICKP